jgi:hypothetical protein
MMNKTVDDVIARFPLLHALWTRVGNVSAFALLPNGY